MTIIESLAAMLVLAIGLMGTFTVFDSSRHLTTTGNGQATAAQVAERELESILSLGYSNIGLTSTPTHTSSGPDSYVTSGGQFDYDWTNTSVSDQFCAADQNGNKQCTGTVAPGPTAWSDQGSSGYIYRFITWAGDTCTNCNGSTDFKRITIAVTVNGPNAPTQPATISTLVSNPSSGPGNSG